MIFGNSHDSSRNANAMAAREQPEGAIGDSTLAGDTQAGPEPARAPVPAPLPPEAGWMRRSPGLMLYVVVPLLFLALPLALFRVTVGPDTSLVLALYLWSATVMVGWLAGALGSALVYRLLARFRPPLWVITLSGPLLVGLLLRQPIIEILALASSLHAGGPPGSPPIPMQPSVQFAAQFLQKLAPGTIAWMVANHVFDHMLGIPRYRYPPANHGGPAVQAKQPQGSVNLPSDEVLAANPALGGLLPAGRGGLVALRSNDHYVRVYADTGESLTLARLVDAIRMAEPVGGMQVHRTGWVADRAICGFRRTGHTGILYLTNGMEMPVSRSYLHQVERRVQELGVAERGPA